MNYYASEVFLMPLLHTWSLSVEMQFYLMISLLLAGLCQVVNIFPAKKKLFPHAVPVHGVDFDRVFNCKIIN